MPRVLWLFEYPTLNGGEYSILANLPELRRREFEIVAAAPCNGPLADLLASLNVPLVDLTEAVDTQRSQESRRASLLDVVQNVGADVVHANSLSMSRLSGPVLADANIPSIGHLRDILRLSKRACADIDRHPRLLAVSNATRDYHVAAGMTADKVEVLYNGVDLDRFSRRAPTQYLHRELNVPADSLLVGTIGQLVARKGLDVAFDAMQRVTAARDDVHYLIVGERFSRKQEAIEYEQRLRDRALQGSLRGRCHFLGVRSDMPELLAELAILLHSARQEPLGRVLLEAAATGTPVVATDVGGTREIFPDASTRAIVAVDQPEELANKCLQLLGSARDRGELSRGGRGRAESAFDAKDAARKLAEIYTKSI